MCAKILANLKIALKPNQCRRVVLSHINTSTFNITHSFECRLQRACQSKWKKRPPRRKSGQKTERKSVSLKMLNESGYLNVLLKRVVRKR